MHPGEYLDLTEHAVRHFYSGLRSCWEVYERAIKHWDMSRIGMPLTKEESERARRYVEQTGKYISLKFSEATLAGAITQVATTGIRVFSHCTSIPDDCRTIVSPKAKPAIRYCIGRRMYGLPVGLILYAARNQCAHFESDPFDVTRNVFRQLATAFRGNLIYDLAFDLENPTIDIYANEILLGALHWTTYEKYKEEMHALIC